MDSKDLSWLASKQKRLKSWQEFAESEIPNKQIKEKTTAVLKIFSEKLFQIWEKHDCGPEDKAALDDLERRLEQLNEEARLLSRQTV